MNEARVRSLDALVSWRSSLIVFQGKARRSISQVTEEVKRVRQWLETQQRPYWEGQIRKRTRKLEQVEAELMTARFSTLQNNLMVQEQAVRKAKAAVQAAEEKLRKTKLWCRDFDRVAEPLVRRLEGVHYYLEHDLPKGVHLLQKLLQSLEGYTERDPTFLASELTNPETNPSVADPPSQP